MQDFDYKHADNETYMISRYRGDEREVSVPASFYGCDISVLMDDVFRNHDEIESVQLPDSLTCICGFVFDGCSSLHAIDLPESLRDFLPYAFVRSSFEKLIIPAGVKIIPPYCFKDCRDLREIVFLADRLQLMGFSFSGCDNLKTVVIPHNTVISETAFDRCGHINISYRDE